MSLASEPAKTRGGQGGGVRGSMPRGGSSGRGGSKVVRFLDLDIMPLASEPAKTRGGQGGGARGSMTRGGSSGRGGSKVVQFLDLDIHGTPSPSQPVKTRGSNGARGCRTRGGGAERSGHKAVRFLDFDSTPSPSQPVKTRGSNGARGCRTRGGGAERSGHKAVRFLDFDSHGTPSPSPPVKTRGSNGARGCRTRGGGAERGAHKAVRFLDSDSSMEEEVPIIKRRKREDRMKVQELRAAQQNLTTSRRKKEQVAEFRMPDAPPKKARRGVSSDRVPCPLAPGTPTKPPARVPRPWEIEPAPVSTPPTRIPSPPWRAASPVLSDSSSPVQQSMDTLPPLVAVIKAESLPTNTEDVFEFEIDFSPETSTCPVALGENAVGSVIAASDADCPTGGHVIASDTSVASTSSQGVVVPDCINIFDEIEDREDAALQSTLVDSGSDIDDTDIDLDDNTVDFGVGHRRFIDDIPSVADDMYPEMLHLLDTMDQQDDQHLHQLASENMLKFTWGSDPEIFTGQREKFIGKAGPTFESEGMTPFEIFQQIWDVSIISLIVRETNKYAQQLLNNPNMARFARLKRWFDITVEELWSFFGIIMLQSTMSIAVEREYWLPYLPYMRIGNFPKLMSFHRFCLIKKCLHFVDNTLLPSAKGPPRLAKVMPVIDHLNHKFSTLYMPEQNIAIDESLLLWKGRLSWAQSINNKAARVGIKTYELCESKSGYLWKVIVHVGKGDMGGHEVREETGPKGTTSQIVYDLVRPLLNKGHTLVMDNFYNSPLLSRTLKFKKTDTMGTLRLSRKFVPEFLRQKTKQTMRPGDVAYSQTSDMTIVVWRDKNVVALISTYHKVEVSGKEKHGQYKYKPKVVLDYNLSMGGIDKKDQLLQAYPMERIRNATWYKKLFRRLLNVSVLNAHVIYNAQAQKKIDSRPFRLWLADEIMQKFRAPQILPEPPGGHFPGKTANVKAPRCKYCYVTKKIDRRTVWKCTTCNINLCMPDCFRMYHIEKNKPLKNLKKL